MENTLTKETQVEQNERPRTRSGKKYRSVEQRLYDCRLAIENTMDDPEIMAALNEFGFNEQRLQFGQLLYTMARDLTEKQKASYGEQYRSTDAVYSTWQEARANYEKTLSIARHVFRNDRDASQALVLNGRRERSTAAWLGQTRTFYSNLLNNEDFVAKMTVYGYTREKLSGELKLVEAVQNNDNRQEAQKSVALRSTGERDAKIAELEEWLAGLRIAALAALQNEPRLLAKLGF